MTKYIVQGGHPLFGEVRISGAKNAAVAIIPAALLVDGVCRIENIPQISDVTALLKILEQPGANVRFLNRSDVEIDCRHIATTQVSQELAHKIRASYYLIGALLGRFGEAEVSMPGGCNFGGVRPIDQHVKGFAAMGAEVREGDFICAKASGDRMKGANVYLDVVSVGATMNIMMAAALADGTTVIENAAKEPHIVDLANFLNSMGANIKGAGTVYGNRQYRQSPDSVSRSHRNRLCSASRRSRCCSCRIAAAWKSAFYPLHPSVHEPIHPASLVLPCPGQ